MNDRPLTDTSVIPTDDIDADLDAWMELRESSFALLC
jgi:hypothetical protein